MRARLSLMRFCSLSISNLRAIKMLDIHDLGNFIVIAGPNGCGKSCIFDAIRLLKSVYGGYQANEYHQWFGEFAINLQDKDSVRKLFRDLSKPIDIRATIRFAESEIDYIRENVEELVQPIAWQEVTGQPVDFWTFSRLSVATQLRQQQPALTGATNRLSQEVRNALSDPTHKLALKIHPSGDMHIETCKPAEAAFQAIEPDHLGVIEYHSASRSYSRQAVGGISLDVRGFEDQRRQQRLYNSQNKYQNIKTELASSYLRSIIAKASGYGESADELNSTLSELFQTFFPEKSYEGVRPQPHGGLEFPVRLTSGEVHDIDELSSGEKEILYGYLKLRTSTPKHSVVLLDEPELHLNPSLIQGFADFYYRHLGVSQDNQLWLVTHSDALLRQAVGNSNYRIYHMLSALSLGDSQNQAVEVLADDDLDRVTIDLVGDLASYRPHGKVVILEGRSENGLDARIVKRLFPEIARYLNVISGGGKKRVRDLYAVLSEPAVQAGVRNRFFAVVDKDSDPQLDPGSGALVFSWDVYHIENYLLDVELVRAATASLEGLDRFSDDSEVRDLLRDCAADLIDRLVLERVQEDINAMFIGAVKIKASPNTTAPARDIEPSIRSSARRVQEIVASLTLDDLERRADEYRSDLTAALTTGAWAKDFPGRLILHRYADKCLNGTIDGPLFLNMLLDKAVEKGLRPPGMETVLTDIAKR